MAGSYRNKILSKVFAPGNKDDGNEKVSLKFTDSVNMYFFWKTEKACIHFDKIQSM